MNFVVNNQEYFRTNSAMHDGVGTTFIDELLTFHVLKKCTMCWHQDLQQSTIKSEKS